MDQDDFMPSRQARQSAPLDLNRTAGSLDTVLSKSLPNRSGSVVKNDSTVRDTLSLVAEDQVEQDSDNSDDLEQLPEFKLSEYSDEQPGHHDAAEHNAEKRYGYSVRWD